MPAESRPARPAGSGSEAGAPSGAGADRVAVGSAGVGAAGGTAGTARGAGRAGPADAMPAVARRLRDPARAYNGTTAPPTRNSTPSPRASARGPGPGSAPSADQRAAGAGTAASADSVPDPVSTRTETVAGSCPGVGTASR